MDKDVPKTQPWHARMRALIVARFQSARCYWLALAVPTMLVVLLLLVLGHAPALSPRCSLFWSIIGVAYFAFLFWGRTTARQKRAESREAAQEGITYEVVVLAGLGIALSCLTLAVYGLLDRDFAVFRLFQDAGKELLTVLVPVASVPNVFYWWIRRDTHKRRDLAQGDMRLLTERYTKAVELLGSDNVSVRLGAIYALESLAHDSEKYHWTVMETLAAFVRDSTSKTCKEYLSQQKELREKKFVGSLMAIQAKNQRNTYQLERAQMFQKDVEQKISMASKEEKKQRLWVSPATDAQAAITVIGRRTGNEKQEEGQRLDLRYCDLRNYDFKCYGGKNGTGGNFAHADFSNSLLQQAEFERADLRDANFFMAHLEGACLHDSQIQGASFLSAWLLDTFLQRASAERNTQFWHTDMRGAFLVGADLSLVSLDSSNDLCGATFSSTTHLPFDENEARERGMIKLNDDGTPLPGWPHGKDDPPRPLPEDLPQASEEG